MAFSPSSGSRSYVDMNLPVVPGVSAPVSAGQFASRTALLAARRYGPKILGAAVNRLDQTVDKFASRLSGSSSSSDNNNNPPKTKSKSSSGSSKRSRGGSSTNDGGSGDSSSGPPGGRRPVNRSTSKNIGAAYDTEGVTRLSLDSGIISGTLVNPIQRTTQYYSPLYIQCGQLFSNIADQDDSVFSSMINQELYFKYRIIVQSSITNSFTRYFTEESFYSYVGLISYALQVYYMIDSILAYTSHNANTNIGMTRLRMAISPDILNSHIKLKEYLEGVPIPPNLLEYIRYLYQNFSFNDVNGSSIIRLSLGDSLCTSEYSSELGLNSETYSQIFESLISSSDTISIMRRIRENWVRTLPPSSYESFYDPQFSTFWHNSNISYEDYGSKAVKYTINTSNFSDQLYYGIFDNRLDGLIYASCSVNTVQNDKNVQQMGLWLPFNDFQHRNSINSSLLHHSNDGLIRPVTEREFRDASLVHAAPYTVITADNNPVWEVSRANFAGSAIPQVHTLENTTQAVVRSVEWLLSP